MNKYIIGFRDICMSIYKNIVLLEKNDHCVNNKLILLFVNLFFHFPIKYILKYSKINYLYKTDSLYFYENYINISNNIYPMVLNFNLIKTSNNDDDRESLLDELNLYDKFKLYNMNVPINMFFINEDIDINYYDTISIKTLKTKQFVKFKIKDCINYKLSYFVT
jgi:hypothetical protein